MIDEQPRHLIVVLVFIRQGDSILLVKQDYGQQYWSLPGGMVEWGESLEQAAAREAREETGLEARVTRVVGLKRQTLHSRNLVKKTKRAPRLINAGRAN